MKLFGFGGSEVSAVDQAEQTVRVNLERRDRLATSLADAERWLNVSKTDAANDVLEHGAALLDDQAQNIASQQAGVEALKTALGRAEGELRDAQAMLAHEQDQAERAVSIQETQTLRDNMRGPAADLINAANRLIPFIRRAGEITFEGRLTAGWLETLQHEAPQAFETVSTALAQHAENIRSGAARPRLPQPTEPKPEVRLAQPAQVSCFPLFDVKWRDGAGLRHAGKFWDIGLAPEIAERAIAHGICVRSDDPQAVKKRPERGSMAADLDRAVDLDQDNPQPPPALPERWGRISPTPRWGDARHTSGPLSSWTGQQSWIRPTTPTNGSGEGF